MTKPGEPSLSAIIASKDAGPDSSSGLSGVSLRLWLVVPALCALAYPSLLKLLSAGLVLLHGSDSPSGAIVWISVVASLTLALAVMLVGFVFGLVLGSAHAGKPEDFRARCVALLAFATPSLYVGFENAGGVLRASSVVPVAWLIFWALMAMIVLLGSRSSPASAMSPVAHRRLALAHGVSALAILLLFVGPHIGNHLAGFWSGQVHIAIMTVVRHVYRGDIVQPVLLALIGFQILSGAVLVQRRMRMPDDIFGTVQTMCGAYIGIYFLAHMTAVFAARHAEIDTNWTWLTRPNDSLLASLFKLRLIAHYWAGPIAIVAHVACGLRWVLLQRDVSPATANRIAWTLITAGFAISSVILLALLNVHIA
ncbi:hypothetical protein [Bradyrhizobium erythrophlei]|jgi:hypothetical protein|uniref:Uncharacterized protein n=1 Tax=Bradyrhizobium erythrophlei TaxID=1437360 RepID=A0A1M7UGR6_9BRAD|nr:hypothetical protein [Bradyrhizobium erythrophlei]SHN82136.1 hypothetical protein SAMN05444170_5019 [Bradyrhizobium erythrophlei]